MSRNAENIFLIRARRHGKSIELAELRKAKIASITSISELKGYRDAMALTGRRLTAEELAALTRREAELQRGS